ncbi:hypothetical protein OHC33_010987 [Knufia fluminis]|uniref:tripeptidyl-peptidase II n=1 Tax=Knufia fluminis TaxID=191047 RepID=A0AAN8E8H8_9EURO|nr:hypothetical protein OHC33_010987 [Knufia fluminis]
MVGYDGFVINGSGFTFIGTSCAAPLYAGLFVVLRSAFGRSFGFLNPTVYQLGTAAFRDVVFGNNDPGRPSATPYFSATAGYDPITGWGSIDGTKMMNSIAKLLFPPDTYLTVLKSSFSLGEVEGKANWDGTILVVLNGFSPNVLPGTVPIATNTFSSDVTITVGLAKAEIPSLPSTVQRILFPISVDFGPTSRHATSDTTTPGVFPPAGSSPIEKLLTVRFTITGKALEANTVIILLAGANPYFSNTATDIGGTGHINDWWLSQDLRVFSCCPGINPSPVVGPEAPILSPRDYINVDSGAGYQYIKNLLNFLNAGFTSPTGTDAFTLLPDQSNALTEFSLVAPKQENPIAPGTFFANYNFAVGRVRLNGISGGNPVRVFFRLFTSNHPQTWFLPGTSYLSSPAVPSPPAKPLVASDMTTIPFFATGNYGSNTDYGTGSGSSWTYFGCFINVYDPGYMLTYSGVTKPLNAWLMGGHSCLVAQIAFDDAPIVSVSGTLASPMNSDKLAQRNLQISPSDNPGPSDTHLISQTFDVAPTAPPRANPGQYMNLPDELMIDWGNTPIDSTASIYWPKLKAADIVMLAKRLYSTHQLHGVEGDPNSIEITVSGGFTYIPIPFGEASHIAGLLSTQLPLDIVRGQEFLITVRRIATRCYASNDVPRLTQPLRSQDSDGNFAAQDGPVGGPIIRAINWRYTPGIFAIKVPVRVPAEMLPIERDSQAIIAWRLNQLSQTDRWYKVIRRYLEYINRRVDALGGHCYPVIPSAHDLLRTQFTIASPNAAVALRLRQTATWRAVSPSYRDAWVAACLEVPESLLDCPQEGEVFEIAPGESISSVAKERSNQYGLAVGIEFTIAKNRAGRSLEIHCKHFGDEKDNKHKLKDSLVRKDPVTGELQSDRRRNRDDQRTGCRVRDSINYKLKPNSDTDKHWVGHWMHDPKQHRGHPMPNNPVMYLPLKRMLEDYQKMESIGRTLRESRMAYSGARTYFLKQGIS